MVANLAEILLIQKKFSEFEELVTSYSACLSVLYEGAAIAYLESLQACLKSDTSKIKTTLSAFASKCVNTPQKPWMPNWDFGDSMPIVNACTDEVAKRIHLQGVDFLSGKIPAEQLLVELNQ